MLLDPSDLFSVFGLVLASSLLGSVHCAAMCGPILWSQRRGGSTLPYHLGRLIGYWGVAWLLARVGLTLRVFVLGFAAVNTWVLFLATFSMGVVLTFLSGKPAGFWIPRIIRKAMTGISRSIQRLNRGLSPAQGWWLGVGTAFLPCGWLAVFQSAALASGDIKVSMIALFAFWLGTLPALAFGVKVVDKLEARWRKPTILALSLGSILVLLLRVPGLIETQRPTNLHSGSLICHSLTGQNAGLFLSAKLGVERNASSAMGHDPTKQ